MFGVSYKIERLTTSIKIKLIVVSVLCCLVASGLCAQTDTTKEEVWDDARMEKYMRGYRKTMRKKNINETLPDLFNSGSEDGFYLGVSNHFEMLTYSLGAEFKYFESYYVSYLSLSFYSNYRHLFVPSFSTIPNSCVSVGGHIAFFGLETNMYYNNKVNLWYLTPKLGADYGNVSVFYGYSLPLNKTEFNGKYGHSLSVKYALYLNAFSEYRERKKDWGY